MPAAGARSVSRPAMPAAGGKITPPAMPAAGGRSVTRPAMPATMGGEPSRPPPQPPAGARRPSSPANAWAQTSPAFHLDEGPLLQAASPDPAGSAAWLEPPAGRDDVLRIEGSTLMAPGVPTEPERRRVSAAGRNTKPFAREAHTQLFRSLLGAAREMGASDLHLIAGRPALIRVAGQVLPRGEPLDPRVVEDMILFRVPRRLDEAFAREGSCDFAVDEPELGRFRVNASRQRTGVKASLRLVTWHVPTLAQLGLPEAIAAATRHHQGLIVLTGPTGHGKTTTLAALVDILNTESTRHVITVEDPIEHVHPRKRALLSQREVGTHTRSFQSALKAALREDPDVIVVGELRDTETVRIALTASETGHLVLGTMSTPSAARAIDRLIDLFPPGDQPQVRMTLAGSLRLIVGQRLVPDVEGKAMVAAAEVLPGMVQLWNLIRENRTYQIPSLQQRGKELGVIRLDDSLRDLVRAGRTTGQKAVAVAEAPDELEQSLGMRRSSFSAMPRQQAPEGGAAAARQAQPQYIATPSSPAFAAPKPPPEPAPSKGLFDFFKKGG